MRKLLLAAAFALVASSAAFAACEDGDVLVTDITKIANRKVDVDKVTVAARALAGQGVTVRVRVYDTLRGAKDIDELADRVMRQCEWIRDGKRLSNLLFIPLAVEKGDIKVATGSAINARISEAAATKAIVTHMVPRWQSYKKDPAALTVGLVSMLDSFKTELARPLTSQTGGTTTIVNHAPSDYSGLWKVVLLIVIAVFVVFGIILLKRSREDAGEASSAQAEATRVRSGCIDRLLRLTDENEQVVRQAKVDGVRSALSAADVTSLDAALSTISKLGKRGTAAFARFDSFDKDDPNRKGLGMNAYRSNQMRYEEIIAEYLEPAEALIADIDRKVAEAQKATAA